MPVGGWRVQEPTETAHRDSDTAEQISNPRAPAHTKGAVPGLRHLEQQPRGTACKILVATSNGEKCCDRFSIRILWISLTAPAVTVKNFHVKTRVIKLKSSEAVAKIQLREFRACSLKKNNTKPSLNQPDTALVFIVQQPKPLKILASG